MDTSPRRHIQYPSADRSDRPDIPQHILNLVNAMEISVVYDFGADALRLASPHYIDGGRFWWATDTLSMWYDDGSTWHLLSPSRAGEMSMWPTNILPAGALLCDGSHQLKATYPVLDAVMNAAGYPWGSDSTHFFLPDMRGNVPVGKDGATFAAVGNVGGQENHQLTLAELAPHVHHMTANGPGDVRSNIGNAGSGGTFTYLSDVGGVSGAITGTWHSLDTDTAGGAVAHNNIQPFAVVNFIIFYQ